MATNNFSIKGIVHHIGDTESKGSNYFMVREIVLRVEDGKFTQFISFQLSQDRVDLADNVGEGQEITVHFSLRGREWQGKYYTTLNCWKLVAEQGTANTPQNVPDAPTKQENPEENTDENLELPF